MKEIKNFLSTLNTLRSSILSLRAYSTLLNIQQRIKLDPGCTRIRYLRKDSYVFITENIGPLEQFAYFHQAFNNTSKTYDDYYVIMNIDERKVKNARLIGRIIFLCKIFMLIFILCMMIHIQSIISKIGLLIVWIWSQI